MMSLPFFGLFAALVLVLAGQRAAAIIMFALSMVVLIVLFKLHATDPLAITL